MNAEEARNITVVKDPEVVSYSRIEKTLKKFYKKIQKEAGEGKRYALVDFPSSLLDINPLTLKEKEIIKEELVKQGYTISDKLRFYSLYIQW